MIKGTAIIGRTCRIPPQPYIRIFSSSTAVDRPFNQPSLNNALLFNKAVAPARQLQRGDSILATNAPRRRRGAVAFPFPCPQYHTVEIEGKPFDTGLLKFGAP